MDNTDKTITCPHCGDIWKYNMVVDHEYNKSIMTENFDHIEDGNMCHCYKCHKDYQLKITSPADISMDDFIYQLWVRCKM